MATGYAVDRRRKKGQLAARLRRNNKVPLRERQAIAALLGAIERELDRPFTRARSLRVDRLVVAIEETHARAPGLTTVTTG